MSDGDTAPDPVITYDCPIAGVEHAVPGPDVRIMRIGDGGFVIACDCGPEPLSEADETPHETVDHLVNIYARDPSPEEWVALEEAAEGWYDTTAFNTPPDDEFPGTHGQRRAALREQIQDIVESEDGRDLDPSKEERLAKKVPCPYCGANAGRKCQRPSGHRIRKPHVDRIDAASDAGILDDSDDGDEQATLEAGWSG